MRQITLPVVTSGSFTLNHPRSPVSEQPFQDFVMSKCRANLSVFTHLEKKELYTSIYNSVYCPLIENISKVL